MSENYIYSPSVSNEFRCRVPLAGSRQFFIVDGQVQGGEKFIVPQETGLDFRLGKGETASDLLQFISVRSKERKENLSYRSRFELEESSSARILLCSHTLSSHHFMTDESVSIHLKAHADLNMVVMQNEHDNSSHRTDFDVRLDAGAVLKMHLITLHGGEISNRLNIRLEGPAAECELSGLYLADGEQKVTTDVKLSHNVPGCRSSQLFKGVLDGRSLTRFDGLIYVAPDAQKTEAYQANHNLLISEDAKIYTRPHLEIYADDVKCSHGATVGSLNAEELFYMRTRGIALDEAKLLQQLAFAYQVLEKISNGQLRERLYDLTEKRLRGEFSRCSDCSRHCC